MNRRASLFVVFVLAIGCTLAVSLASAQAQPFSGKWVHKGPKGVSVLEFFQGEKKLLGPMRGQFHHSLVLDDGRVIEGDGQYTLRFIVPNRGWLTLRFADGHVTKEHEHTLGAKELRLRHHGTMWTYVRQ
jgi:hypothetical protein